MPYQNNGSYLNPYDCHSPYQPGQSLPQYDEKKMMDINCLQRFSGIYVSSLRAGCDDAIRTIVQPADGT